VGDHPPGILGVGDLGDDRGQFLDAGLEQIVARMRLDSGCD